MADLRDKLKGLRKRLGKLEDLLETPKLQSQVLDPLDDIRDTYKARFLQAFDQVTGKCEAVASGCRAIAIGGGFRGLGTLGKDRRLERHRHAGLARPVGTRGGRPVRHGTGRNRVERALRDRPIPEGCPLQVDEAEQYIEQAETAEREAIALVRGVLVAAAKLLRHRRCEAC